MVPRAASETRSPLLPSNLYFIIALLKESDYSLIYSMQKLISVRSPPNRSQIHQCDTCLPWLASARSGPWWLPPKPPSSSKSTQSEGPRAECVAQSRRESCSAFRRRARFPLRSTLSKGFPRPAIGPGPCASRDWPPPNSHSPPTHVAAWCEHSSYAGNLTSSRLRVLT